MAQDLQLSNATLFLTEYKRMFACQKSLNMRTIGLLLLVICFVGCKKTDVSPTTPATTAPAKIVRTTEFSVTSDSLKFTIPINLASDAKKITLTGKLTTSLLPENSSYVILSVGNSVVWHSSLM